MPTFSQTTGNHPPAPSGRSCGGRDHFGVSSPACRSRHFPPTPRQLALLRFIAGHIEAHGGAAPSVRDCAIALRVSGGNAHHLLSRLEERGLIHRHRNRRRTVEVMHAPIVPRAPDGAPMFFVPLHGSEVAHG